MKGSSFFYAVPVTNGRNQSSSLYRYLLKLVLSILTFPGQGFFAA